MFLIASSCALLLTRISFVNYTNCSINNGKKRREPNGERQLIFLLVLLSIHPVLHSTTTNISQITDFALEVLCYTYFETLKWFFWHVLYICIYMNQISFIPRLLLYIGIIKTNGACIYCHLPDMFCFLLPLSTIYPEFFKFTFDLLCSLQIKQSLLHMIF